MDRPRDRRQRGWIPLEEAAAGQTVEIQSVFERDRKLLEYLDELGIRPGVRVRMLERNYDETFTLGVEGKPVKLGRAAAARIWVEPAG
jgi:DtxR family Mn-dependent transcriptional regulator